MAQIDIRSVNVEFPIYNVNARSLKKNFLRVATGGTVVGDANNNIVVKALKNINLTFEHGDQIGLVGHNGSGKSTLLRLLSGIYEPTDGHMRVSGKVSPMLDISLGVEGEFTGYENIYTRGVLLGLSRKEIKKQINMISELTGLGDFLSMPVRTYSSGMKVRLAFAISTSIEPDILLIDEVFAAGDSNFMEKARAKMVSLLTKSSIVVMATHSDELIQEFCNKVLFLDNGQIKYYGSVEKGLALYHQRA